MTEDSLLPLAAALYAADPAACTPLPGGNFAATYAYAHASGPAVLRISPPDETVTLDSAQSMLRFTAFLAARGVPVARPIPSTAGNLVETLLDPAGRTFLVTSFERVPGRRAEELPLDVWTGDLIDALGTAVARFHTASAAYPHAAAHPAWDEVHNLFNPGPEELAEAGPAVQSARAGALAALASLPRDPASWGLAHLDLHFANLLVDPLSRRVTILDFDDCARAWFLMDLAVLRFDLPVLHGQAFAGCFFDRFLAAYAAERPLHPAFPAALPHFLKLLETGLYAALLPDWDPADTSSWVGRFMTGRKERIESGLTYLD